MNLKANLNWKELIERAKAVDYAAWYFDFLGRKNRWLIFIALLFVAAFSGHIWYKYVYNPGWSDEQKKAYISSQDKGTIFNKSKFDEAIASQKKRKENYEKNFENVQDVFRLGEREVK